MYVDVYALKAFATLTISSGAITLGSWGICYAIDTEGSAASDDLDTISGADGQIIIIRAANADRTIVVKHGSGNIYLKSGADISLDDATDALILCCDGSRWFDLGLYPSSMGDMSKSVYDPNDDGVIAAAQIDTALLRIADIDDVPVDGETSAPISSNRMYDHENGADPHTVYQRESEHHILADGKSIEYKASLGGDHSASGSVVTLTAGTNLVFGNVCYVGSDGKLELADADAESTAMGLYIALATINEDATGYFLREGIIRDDTWNWTVGGQIFLSTTSGELTQTRPSGSADIIICLGIALTAHIIDFRTFAYVERA